MELQTSRGYLQIIFAISNRNIFQEKDVHKIMITKNGVMNITKEGMTVELPKTEVTKTKLEGDFYKPTNKLSNFFGGENISLVFKNNGKRFIQLYHYKLLHLFLR